MEHDKRPSGVNVEPLIAEGALTARVEELAIELAEILPRQVVVVGVLTGSFVFVADLVRALDRQDVRPEVRFVQLASYGNATESTGDVQVLGLPEGSFEGLDVLLVDDIQDTGHTLEAATRILKERGAASVRSCVLLDKPSRRQVAYAPDMVGFTIPDVFVVGYGIDYAGLYRHLPYVGKVEAA